MTVIGFHASHEQVHPTELVARSSPRRTPVSPRRCPPTTSRRGASGKDIRVSPGRGWARRWPDQPALRRRERPGAAVPPGDHRSGARHARGDVPRSVLGRTGLRGGLERAHHRGPVATQGRPQRRLRECVDVIRRLLAGEEVSHDGLVTVDRARLWSLPDPAPHADRRRGQRADRGRGRRAGPTG